MSKKETCELCGYECTGPSKQLEVSVNAGAPGMGSGVFIKYNHLCEACEEVLMFAISLRAHHKGEIK